MCATGGSISKGKAANVAATSLFGRLSEGAITILKKGKAAYAAGQVSLGDVYNLKARKLIQYKLDLLRSGKLLVKPTKRGQAYLERFGGK